MYCASCGKKIPEKAKFCTYCGEVADLDSKVSEAPKTEKKPPSRGRKIASYIILIIIFSLLSAFAAESSDPSNKSIAIIFGVGAGILWLFLLYELARVFFKSLGGTGNIFGKIFSFFVKKPKYAIGFLAILLILIVVFGMKISDFKYKQIKPNLDLIQDNLTELFVNKSVGDAIAAGKSAPYSLQKVGENAQTVSERLTALNSPSRLSDYQLAANDWADAMVTFSKDQKNWDTLGQDPGPFTLKLTNPQAQGLLKSSVEQIASLKDYGDDAISRTDKQAMRYIAAKLQVQSYWIDGIDQSTNPSFLSLEISPVYALGRKIPVGTLKRRNPCISKTVCAGDVKKMAQGVYRSALGYVVGEKDAGTSWDNAWKDAEPLIDASGYSMGGVGITQGDKNQPQYPPAVQAFFNECTSKGGIVGGTGGVKERLPTTEDGRTCKYQNGACWDMLTYSGGRYMGGNPGCPERGLVPRIVQKEPEPSDGSGPKPTSQVQPTQKPQATWDGTYSVNANVGCNIPGIYSSGLLPSATNFTVKGNRVFDAQGGSYPIDSSGQARMVINVNASGISVQAVQSYAFYQSGGQAQVKGNITVSGGGAVEGQSFSLNCQGSYSGRRTSS